MSTLSDQIVSGDQAAPLNIATADDEALLAIVIDRLRSFRGGPHAHKANADALAVIRAGLTLLQERTRIARGVEGTHEK